LRDVDDRVADVADFGNACGDAADQEREGRGAAEEVVRVVAAERASGEVADVVEDGERLVVGDRVEPFAGVLDLPVVGVAIDVGVVEPRLGAVALRLEEVVETVAVVIRGPRRGIAMRSDKLARSYHPGLCPTATLHWPTSGTSNTS
jgi:hypothetical protein